MLAFSQGRQTAYKSISCAVYFRHKSEQGACIRGERVMVQTEGDFIWGSQGNPFMAGRHSCRDLSDASVAG